MLTKLIMIYYALAFQEYYVILDKMLIKQYILG